LLKHILFFSFFLISCCAFSQVGINNETPDASSALDITSTTAGILIPRMTQSQRDAVSSPATGLMVYQTDNTPGFYYYGGSSWSAVASSALGFSDYIFETNNQSIGYVYTGGQISTHTISLNYSKKGYMKLSFSAYQGYNSGSGKIDVYDPNNNLIESIDISYGLVSASGVNETLRYWGGFMIEPDWSSLTLQIYHTGGSQGASVYLKSKEVVLFE
jgi:hypothetical protein